MPRPPGAPWKCTSTGNGPLPFGFRIAAATYTPSLLLMYTFSTGESASLTTWMYLSCGQRLAAGELLDVTGHEQR